MAKIDKEMEEWIKKTGGYLDFSKIVSEFEHLSELHDFMIEVNKRNIERIKQTVEDNLLSEKDYFHEYSRASSDLFSTCVENHFYSFLTLLKEHNKHSENMISESIALEQIPIGKKRIDGRNVYKANLALKNILQLHFTQRNLLVGCLLIINEKKDDITRLNNLTYNEIIQAFEETENGKYCSLLLDDEYRHIRNSNAHPGTKVFPEDEVIEFNDRTWKKRYSFEDFTEIWIKIISWHLGVSMSLNQVMVTVTNKVTATLSS